MEFNTTDKLMKATFALRIFNSSKSLLVIQRKIIPLNCLLGQFDSLIFSY